MRLRSPFVRIFAASSARSICNSATSDEVSSSTPGAWSVPSGSRFTVTSVPRGCTVSMCATNAMDGPPPVPARRATTLPIPSIDGLRPIASSWPRIYAARFSSCVDGAGISVSVIHSLTWASKCPSMYESACLTSGRSASAAENFDVPGCAAISTAVTPARRSGVDEVRVIGTELEYFGSHMFVRSVTLVVSLIAAGTQMSGAPATAFIMGRVVDGTTERPMAGVIVTLTSAAISGAAGTAQGGGPPARVITDSNGRFLFRNLPAGRYNFGVGGSAAFFGGGHGMRRPGGATQPLDLAEGEKASD